MKDFNYPDYDAMKNEFSPMQTEPVGKGTEKFETLHGLNQDGLKEFLSQDARLAKDRMPGDIER